MRKDNFQTFSKLNISTQENKLKKGNHQGFYRLITLTHTTAIWAKVLTSLGRFKTKFKWWMVLLKNQTAHSFMGSISMRLEKGKIHSILFLGLILCSKSMCKLFLRNLELLPFWVFNQIMKWLKEESMRKLMPNGIKSMEFKSMPEFLFQMMTKLNIQKICSMSKVFLLTGY